MRVEISEELYTLVERIGPQLFALPGVDETLPPVREGSVGLVAFPEDSEGVAAIMREAHSLGLKVAPRGSGSKPDRGNPAARIDLVLDLSRLNRVIEHASGDLTVTVEAGVRLEELEVELAKAGQFLALDPPFAGTVGGLIATGDSGPRRLRYGGVRDQLLGVKFVRADGVVARGGGKVVKNVAGYDLPKLFTGALGTLGVITEAVFRLYALPASSATVVVAGCSPLEARVMSAQVIDSPLVPTMIDYASMDGITCLAVRFEGPARSVIGQSARLRAMFGKGQVLRGSKEREAWDWIGMIVGSPTLARLVAPASEIGRLLDRAQDLSNAEAMRVIVRGHMGHGHALLGWVREDNARLGALLLALRREAEATGGNLLLWRGPDELREVVEAWGDAGEGIELMRRIKKEFDPHRTLNPGRFVGGI